MDQHPLLRPRTSWFAPWTWKWRKREIWGLIGVVLVAYPLSPGVIQYAVDRFHLSRSRQLVYSVRCFLYPPRLLAKTWPYLAVIYTEEYMWLRDLFGSPTVPESPVQRHYSYTLYYEGGVQRGSGSRRNGFRDQRNGKLTALTKDGDLIVNDKAYGKIPDGSSLVIEKDGRVLLDDKVLLPR